MAGPGPETAARRGGDGATPPSPDPGELAAELERRLRDQVSRNAVLDAELRYLKAELEIRAAYVRSLEQELEEVGSVVGHQQLALAEYAAYRQRVSHRSVDRAITGLQRSPVLYRMARQLAGVVRGRRRPAGSS
jgi:hypothetical protein